MLATWAASGRIRWATLVPAAMVARSVKRGSGAGSTPLEESDSGPDDEPVQLLRPVAGGSV